MKKTTTRKTDTSSSPAHKKFFSKEQGNSFFSSSTEEEGFFHNTLPVQPKLRVGNPDDPQEHEADQVADQVVQRLSKTDTKVQKKPIFESNVDQDKGGQQPQVQTKDLSAESGNTTADELQPQTDPSFQDGDIQKKSNSAKQGEPSPGLEGRLNSSKGQGAPLPDDTRESMERAFGRDFSAVRVHTDSKAAQMNTQLGAQAFTHGSDIYFNEGKYDTDSSEGQRLLAHEMTHTVQQGQASLSGNQIQRAEGDAQVKEAVECIFDLIWTHSGEFKTPAAKANEIISKLRGFKNKFNLLRMLDEQYRQHKSDSAARVEVRKKLFDLEQSLEGDMYLLRINLDEEATDSIKANETDLILAEASNILQATSIDIPKVGASMVGSVLEEAKSDIYGPCNEVAIQRYIRAYINYQTKGALTNDPAAAMKWLLDKLGDDDKDLAEEIVYKKGPTFDFIKNDFFEFVDDRLMLQPEEDEGELERIEEATYSLSVKRDIGEIYRSITSKEFSESSKEEIKAFLNDNKPAVKQALEGKKAMNAIYGKTCDEFIYYLDNNMYSEFAQKMKLTSPEKTLTIDAGRKELLKQKAEYKKRLRNHGGEIRKLLDKLGVQEDISNAIHENYFYRHLDDDSLTKKAQTKKKNADQIHFRWAISQSMQFPTGLSLKEREKIKHLGGPKVIESLGLGEMLVGNDDKKASPMDKYNIRNKLWDEILQPGSLIQSWASRPRTGKKTQGHSFFFIEYVYSPQENPPFGDKRGWELYGSTGTRLDPETGQEIFKSEDENVRVLSDTYDEFQELLQDPYYQKAGIKHQKLVAQPAYARKQIVHLLKPLNKLHGAVYKLFKSCKKLGISDVSIDVIKKVDFKKGPDQIIKDLETNRSNLYAVSLELIDRLTAKIEELNDPENKTKKKPKLIRNRQNKIKQLTDKQAKLVEQVQTQEKLGLLYVTLQNIRHERKNIDDLKAERKKMRGEGKKGVLPERKKNLKDMYLIGLRMNDQGTRPKQKLKERGEGAGYGIVGKKTGHSSKRGVWLRNHKYWFASTLKDPTRK